MPAQDSQPDLPSDDGAADTLPADDAIASPPIAIAPRSADGESVESWLAALASAPALGLGPTVGEVVGGEYRIEERLGEGSMGVVYVAHHLALERRVAIKLHRATTTRAAERLLREAQTVAKVRHDNVLVVHGVGTWKDHVFVAMEYVDGGSARQWLADKPRDWREIVALYVEAGRGLAAAHAAGVLHRDFKPDNVLVARDAARPERRGSVRVADFGLAVRLDIEATGDDAPAVPSRVSSAQLSGLVGSPAYMAPEQYGRGSIDARADQFAFCVALWEACFGRRPFEGADLRELAAAIIEGEITDVPPSDVPAHVRRVLRRGLSRDREARYPDMDALLADLVRDPTAARRRGLIVLAAVGATAALTWGAMRRPDPIAACIERPAIATWYTPAHAEVLRAAMHSSGRSFAAETFSTVDAALAAHSRAATDSLVRACRATHEEGTRSMVELDAHRECLTQRGREVTALLDVLGRGDPEIVDRAVGATLSLTPIDRCEKGDEDADLREVAAADRPRVDAALELIARAGQLASAGRLDEAIEVALAGRAEVEALGIPRLLAKLLLVLAGAEGSQRLHDRASATLRQANAAAVRAGADLVAAEIAIEGVMVDGYKRQHAELREHWAELAYGWIERAGSPPDLRRELLQHHALALRADDRYIDAVAIQGLTLALQEREAPDNRLERAGHLAAFGATLRVMGEPAKALPILEAARADYAAALGEEHPFTINADNLVASSHWNLGNIDEAERLFRHVIDVGGRTLGPDSQRLFDARANLGIVLLIRGRVDEALTMQEKLVAEWKAAGDQRDENLVNAMNMLVETYAQAGQGPRAREMQRETIALAREIGGPDSVLYASQLATDATLHLDIDPKHAFDRASEAVAIMAKHATGDSPGRLLADVAYAAALAHVDRCAEAKPALLDVLERLENIAVDHPATLGPRAALGHCHVVEKQWDAAIAELERAAKIEAAKLEAIEKILITLEQAYRGKGDTERADAVRERLATLAAAD